MATQRIRTIPAGCTITDIQRGRGRRAQFVYCNLRDSEDNIIISATLDYVTRVIELANIGNVERPANDW